MLKQFKANESLMAAPGPLVKVEQPEPSLAESALYTKSRGGGSKKGHGEKSEEFDWGIQRSRLEHVGNADKNVMW